MFDFFKVLLPGCTPPKVLPSALRGHPRRFTPVKLNLGQAQNMFSSCNSRHISDADKHFTVTPVQLLGKPFFVPNLNFQH